MFKYPPPVKRKAPIQKSHLLFFLFILIVNTSIGQVANGLRVVKKFYDWPKNTRLEEIYTINSIGQKQGTYKWYNIFSVTTSPEHEWNYKNDMLDGLSKRYFTFTTVSLSGLVKETCVYKEDKKNGKEIFYDYVYNGEYASKYKSDEQVVPFIQKGKRVIREESDYSNDILLAKKTYHANGKNAINQKFDKAGELLSEVITNEEGVVTYENRFDDDGNFIKKLKLFPNGKLNILNEKDSTGQYVNKEFYETGVLKTEIVFDASGEKKLSEINYSTNGKINHKMQGDNEVFFYEDGKPKESITKKSNGDISKEVFFDDGSPQKITKSNNQGSFIEQAVYASPSQLEYTYTQTMDSSVYIEFDNNKPKFIQKEYKNKQGTTSTIINNGNTIETAYLITRERENYLQTKEADKKVLFINEYDSTKKLISNFIYKYENSIRPKNLIKKFYDINGGYKENIYEYVRSLRNDVIDEEKQISQKEVDNTGAYVFYKFNWQGITEKKSFDARGGVISDSTSEYKIDYDTAGNKLYERIKASNRIYDEYQYQPDGIIRYRHVDGQNSTAAKYPQVQFLKFSKTLNKNIKLGTIYFNEKGDKEYLAIYDQSGNQIKLIKIKDKDETQYFNYFLKVE